MSLLKGFEGRCGLAKNAQTTWALIIANPTAAPTDLVTLLSENITDDFERVPDESIYGGAGLIVDSQGVQPITGDLNVQVVFDTTANSNFWGTDLLFALAIGSCAWNTGGAAFNDLIVVDNIDDLSGTPICGTMSIDKKVSTTPWQYNGMYVNGFTLTGNAKENIKATFPIISYDVDRAAGTYTAAELVTLYANVDENPPMKLLFSDLTFRIGDDADALDATDNYGINSFTFTFNRNLTDPEFSTPDATTGQTATRNTIEPVSNGFREVTLQIVLPRYYSDAFFTWRDADELLQCYLKFSASSGAREFNLLIPTMKITNVSVPIGGSGVATVTVDFKVFLKHSDNSYLTYTSGTAITQEFGLEMQNTDDGRTAAIF